MGQYPSYRTFVDFYLRNEQSPHSNISRAVNSRLSPGTSDSGSVCRDITSAKVQYTSYRRLPIEKLNHASYMSDSVTRRTVSHRPHGLSGLPKLGH